MAAGAGGGGSVGSLSVSVSADVAAALVGFATLQGAIGMVVDQVKQFIASGIEMNSFLESTELQFRTLTGSAAAAHDQVAMLVDLAAHSPFTFESVTVASRQLEVYGGAALNTRDNLVLLGDAAAATGAPIQQVTFWTGRLYAQLQAGGPIGEASRWLQRMGVLSAEARVHMDALSESGASANEVWKAFTDSQLRFGGAMKEQEKTWVGLTSTMKDQFAIVAGVVTEGLFTQLEGQIRGLNEALADPKAQQGAERLGVGLGALASFAATVAASQLQADILLLDGLNSEIEQAAALLDTLQRGSFLGLKPPTDMPTTTSGGIIAGIDAARRYADAADDVAAAQERTNRVLGAAQAAGDSAARGYESARAAAEGLRDEMVRIGAQQPILNQQREAAHDAEMQRLYDEGQALAHAGDINQIVAQEQVAAQQFRAKQIEAVAEQNARTQRAWFDAAADAIRQKNQETADAIREAQQAGQDAVRRAYVGTADEAEAQFKRIANASRGVVGGMTDMQREIDEAINRQVRGGTAGTPDAEKQLDDIRRRYLTTLPDLVALDQQWAAAKVQSRDADLALAAAQRDLDTALAATGGQQTLQTAALSHAVTTARLAVDAAHDHERALAAQRGEAVALTNALKGVSAQQEAMAVASKSQDLMGGGRGFSGGGWSVNPDGTWAPPMFDLRGNRLPPPRGSVSLTDFNRGVRSREWQAVNVNFNAPVYGAPEFDQRVKQAAETLDRTGNLKLTRYAQR